MNHKNWIIPIVIIILIVLVIIYKDKFVIREEEIIEADYCEYDFECVLAVNPYVCCIQPVPMNKRAVELDEDFVVYEEGKDYSSYARNNEICYRVDCPYYPPISANISLKCSNNKCSFET